MSDQPEQRMLTVNTDLGGGLALLVFGVTGLLLGGGDSFDVWIFPHAASFLLIGAGVVLVIKGVVAPERRAAVEHRAAATIVLGFIAGLSAYYVLFSRLGFVVTTILLYALATWVLRRRFTLLSAVASLALAAVVTLALYQVFEAVFHVPLPTGSWWEALGWD